MIEIKNKMTLKEIETAELRVRQRRSKAMADYIHRNIQSCEVVVIRRHCDRMIKELERKRKKAAK